MGLKTSKINKHIHSKEDTDRPIVYYFNNIEDPMINERVRRKYRRIQASIDNLKIFGRTPYRSMKRWNSTGDLAFNRGNNSERFKKASKSMNNLVEHKGPSPEDQLNGLVQKLKEIRRRIKNYDGSESTAEIKMDLDQCLSELNTIDSNNKMVLELRAKMGEKINHYQESIEQKSRKYTANQTKLEEIEAKIDELTGDVEYYYRTGEQEEYQSIKTSIDSCVKLLDCLDASDDVSMMKLKENYEKTLFDFDHEIDSINSKAADKSIAYNRSNSMDTDDEFFDCYDEIPLTPKSVKNEAENPDNFEYYSRKLDQVEQNFEKLMSEKKGLHEKEPPLIPRRNILCSAKNMRVVVNSESKVEPDNIYEIIDVPKVDDIKIKDNLSIYGELKTLNKDLPLKSQISMTDEEEPPKLRPKFKQEQIKKIDVKSEEIQKKSVDENVIKTNLEDDEEVMYVTIDEAKAILDEKKFKEESEYETVAAVDYSEIYAVPIKIKKDVPSKPQVSLNDAEEPPKLRPKLKGEPAEKLVEVNDNEIYQINENIGRSNLANNEECIYETIDLQKALVDENNDKEECEYETVAAIDHSEIYAVPTKIKKDVPTKPQVSLNDAEEPPKLRPKLKGELAEKLEEVNDNEIYQINENIGRSNSEKYEECIYETIDLERALVDESNFKEECKYATVSAIDDSQIYLKPIENESLKPQSSLTVEEEPPKLRPRFKDEQPNTLCREASVNEDEIYQVNENAIKTEEDNLYDAINEEKALIDEMNYKDECMYEPIPVLNHLDTYEIQKSIEKNELPVNVNIMKEKPKLRPRLEVERSINNDPDEGSLYEEYVHLVDENKVKYVGNKQKIEEQEVVPKPRPRTINNSIYGNIVEGNTQNNGKENYVLETPEYIEIDTKEHEINPKTKATEESIVKENSMVNNAFNDEGKFKEVEEGVAKAIAENLESWNDSSQVEYVKFDKKHGGGFEKDVMSFENDANVNENYKNAEVVLTTEDDGHIYENYDANTDLDVNGAEKKRTKLADISESPAFSQTFSDEESEDFSEDEPLASSAAISDENRRPSHIPKLLSVIYEESSFDEESVRTKEDSSEECVPQSESPPMSRRFSVTPMPDSTRIAFDSVLECVQNMKECVDDFEGTKTDSDYISIFENLMKSMSILNGFKVDDNETIEYKQRILHEIIQCMKDLECKVKPAFTY